MNKVVQRKLLISLKNGKIPFTSFRKKQFLKVWNGHSGYIVIGSSKTVRVWSFF